MARPIGFTTKSVYIEVTDELWTKLKIHCFKNGKTLKEFVRGLIEKELGK